VWLRVRVCGCACNGPPYDVFVDAAREHFVVLRYHPAVATEEVDIVAFNGETVNEDRAAGALVKPAREMEGGKERRKGRGGTEAEYESMIQGYACHHVVQCTTAVPQSPQGTQTHNIPPPPPPL
jgi:hypothetical protein